MAALDIESSEDEGDEGEGLEEAEENEENEDVEHEAITDDVMRSPIISHLSPTPYTDPSSAMHP